MRLTNGKVGARGGNWIGLGEESAGFIIIIDNYFARCFGWQRASDWRADSSWSRGSDAGTAGLGSPDSGWDEGPH